MPLPLFAKILEQVRPEYQVDSPKGRPMMYLFHFGEPTWYPHFAESIEMCKRRGLGVSISDTAAQFSPKSAREAIESGLDEVFLMQEGMDDKTSTAIRGPANTWEKGVANIKALLDLKRTLHATNPYVHVVMVRQVANRHQWEQFLQYWQKTEGVHAFVSYFSTFGGNVPEINALWEGLQQIGGQPEWDRHISELNSYRCFYPWQSITVMSDGKVVPCCRDLNGTYIYGDLNEKTLKEIWNDDPIRAMRREWIEGHVTNPLCKPCIEANNEIGLPNKFYPGFDLINKIFPKSYRTNRSVCYNAWIRASRYQQSPKDE